MGRIMTRSTATAIGFVAVLLWALLAVLTVGTSPVPPLQLNAICFSIGGALGLGWCYWTGTLSELRRQPIRIYAFGTAGLFGYHFLYFTALRMAPAAEASLIAYLWPLLIVLFSGLLPGERLRALHIVGAIIGFAGAAVIVGGGGVGFQAASLPGYGIALLCAVTWATYSVVSRSFGAVPTSSVTVFCLATAALSLPAHLIWETTVWPASATGWFCILGLGLGPVGLAFYVWDMGVKRGDIQLLGVSSYAAPLLSTGAMIAAGYADMSMTLVIAAGLITAGAALAVTASARK